MTPGDREPAATEALVERALSGGVSALLLRERQLAPAPLTALYARLIARCREHGALALVSREARLARELGADGVHGGHAGPDQARCRREAPGLLQSRSAHWPLTDEDRRADWVTLSPCAPTPKSLPRPSLSPAQLREAVADPRLGAVVALGGLTAEHVTQLPDGLAGVAVMRALSEAPDPRAAARELRTAVDRRWWPDPPSDHDVRRGVH